MSYAFSLWESMLHFICLKKSPDADGEMCTESFGWLQLNPDNHPSWLGCSWAMVDLLGHLGGDLSLCGWIYSRIVSCFMLSKHPLPLTKIPLVDMGYHMLCKHSFITDVGYHKSCKHPHADIFLSWWDFTDLKCF